MGIHSGSGQGKKRSRVAAVLASLLVAAASGLLVGPQAQAASPTVVSLTFDDGHASHAAVGAMLQERGMVGTFYINSGMVGSSGYDMNWSQVQELHNTGNEIGGHTLTHVNLTQVDQATATREVCDDRTALRNRGLGSVISFAYPYAVSNATAESVVQSCGYTTGRRVGGLGGGTYAEPIPPASPFRLRTAAPGESGTTLAQLQAAVTNAENNGGGWVPMVFHGVCTTTCTGSNTLNTSIFTAFLDWLRPRSATGTVVRTVGEVMTGTNEPPPPPPPPAPEAPTTAIACDQVACLTGWYRKSSVTVSLAAADPAGSATTTYYTLDGNPPTTSSTRYTGPFQVTQTTTVRFFSTNSTGQSETPKSQEIQLDAAAPNVRMTNPTPDPSTGKAIVSRRANNITLRATANDGTGGGSGIARVVFYDGTTAVGTATSPSSGTTTYSVTWRVRKAALGDHQLTAVATDVAGNTTTSAAVTVNVTR